VLSFSVAFLGGGLEQLQGGGVLLVLIRHDRSIDGLG
jgi:hypothetical protein